MYRLAAPSTPAEIVESVTAKAAAGEIVPDITVKEMIETAARKLKGEQAKQRMADRRSRSKTRRREEERRDQARREAEEQHRADMAQAVATVIDEIGIHGAGILCAEARKVGYELIWAIEAQIAEAARPTVSKSLEAVAAQ